MDGLDPVPGMTAEPGPVNILEVPEIALFRQFVVELVPRQEQVDVIAVLREDRFRPYVKIGLAMNVQPSPLGGVVGGVPDLDRPVAPFCL